RTRRPVLLASSREESIYAYAKRHPFTLHYKTGVTKDGRLTAMQVRIIADAGPFVYRSALVSLHSLMLATGPYYVPHVSIDVQAGSKKIGRGISANISGYGVPGNTAACDIEIQQDGHIIVSMGVCDIGGGQRSSIAQIAASLLGVPPEDVTLRLADTAMTPP